MTELSPLAGEPPGPPLPEDRATRGAGAQILGIGRSVGILAAGEVVNKVARFAALVVLARALPVDEFGQLNVGIAIGGIVVVLMRLGLPDLGTREVAARPDRAATLAGPIVTVEALGMGGVTVLAAVAVMSFDSGLGAFVLMAGASMFGLCISGDWVLRGQERMSRVTISNALGGLVVLVAAVIVTQYSGTAIVALSAFAVGEIAAASATWYFTGIARRVRPTLRGAGDLLKRAWPLAASGVVIYLFYANIDTIILAAVRSEAEAGLYSGPYRVFLALNATVLFAAQALMPVITRATVAQDADRAASIIRGCIGPLLVYGLLCLAAAELLGETLLVNLFGADFAGTGSTLVLLCLAIPWYAVGFPVGYALIATEQSRGFLRGAATASVVNVGLNIALIPPFGVTGAAIATVTAFAAGAVVWLHQQRLLASVRGILVALVAATAGAITVRVEPALADVVGLATLLAGLVLLVAYGRNLRGT